MSLTSILDSREQIQAIDPDGALASAESIADQVKQVWEEQTNIDLTVYQNQQIKQVVVAGMGGSALGADLIKHLYRDELTVPLEIVKDYDLPAFVGSQTLVILSSYSGNTEETLAAAAQAKTKGAPIAVIAAGGKLAELAQAKNYPHYLINPQANPSNQPRMATAYNITAMLLILSKLKLLNFTEENYHQVLDIVNRTTEKCLVEVPQDQNQAKLLAYMILERRPILVGASFLEGALHIAANQFNENAKSFADYKIVPEINHHLLEGLSFPQSNPLHHFFVFFQSKLYHPQIQRRITLTQQAVNKAGIESFEVVLESESKLMQAFELVTLSTFTNLYLAYLEKTNPCPIPVVDWFKRELEKST